MQINSQAALCGLWKFSMPGVSGTATLNAYFRYTVS
jgi:hypothetical protein